MRLEDTSARRLSLEGLTASIMLAALAYWFERRGSPESGIQLISMVFVIAILRPWLPQRRA